MQFNSADMTVTEREWKQASEQCNVVRTVLEIVEEGAPRAYCVDDFFRNAEPGSPQEHGLLEAFKRAVLWQMSRKRSKELVRTALETLVVLGEVEKRSLPNGSSPVVHYRVKPPAEERF